jgi:hypothetical protein
MGRNDLLARTPFDSRGRIKSAKMILFAQWCGARALARSGQPAVISGYVGKADTFDRAIAAFALSYADQCERDHECLVKSVREGKLVAHVGN